MFAVAMVMTGAAANAGAQRRARPWRIGFLSIASKAAVFESSAGGVFLRAMRELGYVEARDFHIEWRFADGKLNLLPKLAAELQQSGLDVIVAIGSYCVDAARKATSSIPIVMTGVGNPVASGFVASLSHPGGNITGLSNISIVISGKYLELLHSAVPRLSAAAVLIDPTHPNHPTVLAQIQAAAKTLGVRIMPYEVRDPDRIQDVLRTILRARADGLIVPPGALWEPHERGIADTALKNRLPTMFGGHPGALEAGGLLGYEPNRAETYRRAAALVEKILKGAKPADLPVEMPSRFDLTINLKTARALGLAIPQELLVRADKVIE